jgi:hypothetical protein
MAGHQLFRFVMNFQDSGKDDDVVALGIAPFTIVIGQLPLMILSIVTFALAAGVFIFLIVRQTIEYGLWDGLKMLGIVSATLLVAVVTGAIVYGVNSLSYCCNFVFGFVSVAIFGDLVFVGFVALLKAADIAGYKWQLFFTCLNGLLSAALCFCDFALPFWWATVWSFGYFLCLIRPWGQWLMPLFNIVALIPFLFEFTTLWVVAARYSVAIPGVIPDLLLPLFGWLMTIEVGFATVACVVRENLKATDRKLTTANEWKLTFPLAVLLLIVFLVIGPPYSNDYTILGSRQQLVFENGSSLIVFAPLMGRRTAGHLKKLVRYQLLSYEDSVHAPYVDGPAVVRRIDRKSTRLNSSHS